MSAAPLVTVSEVRLLEGPNLYFTRPVADLINVTLSHADDADDDAYRASLHRNVEALR